jgi:hypothetical protein
LIRTGILGLPIGVSLVGSFSRRVIRFHGIVIDRVARVAQPVLVGIDLIGIEKVDTGIGCVFDAVRIRIRRCFGLWLRFFGGG